MVSSGSVPQRVAKPRDQTLPFVLRQHDNGLLIRATGEIIVTGPPLIVGKAHIVEMFGKIGELLARLE